MSVTESSFQAIEWTGDGLRLLDQRRLPGETRYLDFTAAAPVAGAIRDLVVRGAPAIGITAAYAVVLSAQRHRDRDDWQAGVAADIEVLAGGAANRGQPGMGAGAHADMHVAAAGRSGRGVAG